MCPRRQLVVLGVILVGVVLLASSGADAAPTVHFKAEPVPIPAFRHTGYIFGAGTALRAEYEISGTEYDGSPWPLIGVNVYLPAGAEVHPSGFPTCALALLEQHGGRACAAGSSAGPVGQARGIVSFGEERVEETTTIESFYAPGGGLEFFTVGHSPVSLEIPSSGHYQQLHGAGGYGLELVTQVPLVSTVPGADYASVESIDVEAGSALASHGKTLYYGTVPKNCPHGGFPVKTEVIFDQGGVVPPVPEVVTVSYHAPCPRK